MTGIDARSPGQFPQAPSVRKALLFQLADQHAGKGIEKEKTFKNGNYQVQQIIFPLNMAEFVYQDRFDLSIPQWRLICVLAEDGGMTQAQIVTRTFMDKVHHNEKGNQITMVKRRDK